MNDIDKIKLVVGLENLTNDLNGEDFNKNKDALKVYAILYGEDKLKEVLNSKNDLHLNRFYYPDSSLRMIIEKSNLKISEIKENIEEIKNKYARNWLKVFLIEQSVKKDEIDIALNLIDELPDEDVGPVRYVGHRVLLKYFAEKGNVKEFLERLKPSKPSKFPKNHISDYKYILIENYSKQYGFKRGLELCKQKEFGEKFAMASVKWNSHQISLEQIDKLIENYPEILASNADAKPDLYVKHFYNQKPTGITESDFLKTTEEILKVNKDVKVGDIRFRDHLFWDLGSSTEDLKQVMECRKQINSPKIKKELSYHIVNIKQKK